METPPSNDDSLKSLPQSTSRRLPPFFQKRLANKQMLRHYIKHSYHSSSIKICQSSPWFSQDPRPIKDPALASCPVSSVKECNRKGVKCIISLVLQSPASPRVEASDINRLTPLSTCRKVQMETSESIGDSLIPGECLSSIDLSDAYSLISIFQAQGSS